MTLERKIQEDVESHIRSGEWAPGYKIPFEHELVAQYGCSRATVSKAVSALAKAGLIERRRKAGSFVARPRVHSAVMEIFDIAAVVAERGKQYRFELLQTRKRAALKSSAAEQQLGTGATPQLFLEGLHYAATSPLCHEARIINLAEVAEAEQQDFSSQNPGGWLLSHIPWTDARHRICALGADERTARYLDLPPGAPCLQMERWTWRIGNGVTYVRQTFPADQYDLVGEFKPYTE